MRNPNCKNCSFGNNNIKQPTHACLMPAVEDIPDVEVMIVAEQPTLQDDTFGRIFTGKGLSTIPAFFDKNDIAVYSTYALKCCRPHKDTKPDNKHVKMCAFGYNPETRKEDRVGYLQQEIAHVKPKHIICLGANAHFAVARKKCPQEHYGSRYFDEKLNAYIYPTLHWMQALYNQQVKQQLWADLERFVGWIKGTSETMEFMPRIYVADTLEALRIMQKKIRKAPGKIVAVDTETQGLNPYLPDKHIRTIQFCWDENFGAVVVPVMLEEDCYWTSKKQKAEPFWQDESLADALGIIQQIFLESKQDWHNGKFDRIWFHEDGKRLIGKPIVAPNIHMDTLHVAHMIDENRILKLKSLITSELGYPTYDIGDKLTKDLDELFVYGGRDTVCDLMLQKKYSKIMAEPDMRRLRKLYTKVVRRADALFTKMELRGWPVSRKWCEKVKEPVEEQLSVVTSMLLKILEKHDIKVTPTTLGSTQQLAKIIFQDLGYPLSTDKKLAYTKTKAISTNSDALLHLKKHEFIRLLLEWRSLVKTLSTYINPMIEFANTRGRITTSYKLTGTVTGRTASGKETEKKAATSKAKIGMNLQNLPYDKFGPDELMIRHCIRARKGWKIIEVDFSQIELRIAGWLAKDPLLLKAYQEDKDIHAIRAMRIMGLTPDQWAKLPKELQKEYRGKAKAANFGFIYGMLAHKYKTYALTNYDLDLSLQECTETRNTFFSDHTGLESWYGKQEREALRKGYVESPDGRRRHLPNIRLDVEASKEAKMKYGEAVRMSINTPVQGFGSDMKLMSMIEIDERLERVFKKRDCEEFAYVFGEVHDSILLECRDEHVEEVVRMCLNVMKHPRILDELGIVVGVPVKAEAKVGQSLGGAQDYKLAA